MLMAMLRGKLSREQENLEDILTSNVFGALQYTPGKAGVLRFLACASRHHDPAVRPLAELAGLTDAKVWLEFWPLWRHDECTNCEPDVVVYVEASDGRKWVVVVEAKYRSPKSSEADLSSERPTDQLAKQWDHLCTWACQSPATPALVYLTAGAGPPRDDMDASIAEYEEGPDRRPISDGLCWLSWRHLKSALAKQNGIIEEHLLQLVDKLGLVFFEGIGPFKNTEDWEWSFEERRKSRHSSDAYAWVPFDGELRIDWRFDR